MNSNLIDNRQIRIFISSTFRDMQDERDYLMKRTFPKLRKLAAERDVTLTELDLRWGITEDEAKSGKVVEICFREIENSIPFFIGIIGNRYGWVPTTEEINYNILERFPVVDKYLEDHLSVTEMEMQFGVLSRNENMHAYFHIKEDGSIINNLDEEESSDKKAMLARLKKDVSDSKYPSFTYNIPEDLACQVEDNFIKLLDDLFPEDKLTELEKERIGQQSFINQLCNNYIKDEDSFARLDSWLQEENEPQFVVAGESGLGKSALFANWIKEKKNDPQCKYNIIYHFIGNGGSESNSGYITKTLFNEICDVYGFDNSIGYGEIDIDVLGNLFAEISTQDCKPLLIVIDAVNQLVDIDNEKMLDWLPNPRKKIKVLFSTIVKDRTFEGFKVRNFPFYTIKPISRNNRIQMIVCYLKSFGKSLNDKQVDRIASCEICNNTLVLKTLLDELINYGIYEEIDKRLDFFLNSESTDDFYQKLLESYETEFMEYGSDFTKNILSIIAASYNGLSEKEIMGISKAKQLQWSQLYCLLNNFFCSKLGNISFSHTNIKKAIEDRYNLNDPKQSNCIRTKIINYFSENYKNTNRSAYVEVLNQLYKVENDRILYNELKNPFNTAKLYFYDKELCRTIWFDLKQKGYSFKCLVDNKNFIFRKELELEDVRNLHRKLTFLLQYFGEHEIGLKLSNAFLKYQCSKTTKNPETLAKLHNDIGYQYAASLENGYSREILETALNEFLKAQSLSKKYSLNKELIASYNGIASLYAQAPSSIVSRSIVITYDVAIKMAKKAINLAIDVYGEIHHEVATCYNNIAGIYDKAKNPHKAIECYKKAIEILTIKDGNYCLSLINGYTNLAMTLRDANRFKEALDTVNKAQDVIKYLYGNTYYDMDFVNELKSSIEKNINLH